MRRFHMQSSCLQAFGVSIILLCSVFILPVQASNQGTFIIKPSISVKFDPAGHAQYIVLKVTQLKIVISGEEITISDPPPWVDLSGTISSDGTFTASGQGTVAGYPGVAVTMSGTLQNGNLDSTLIMGGDGKLPTGQSITYSVSGTSETQTQPPVPSNTGQAPVTSNTEQAPANQEINFKIPSWIKNNAKWWSDGQIGDSDMIKGLQFLISDGIMVIPTTTHSQNTIQQIPTWVKNNAQWWAAGQISDSEFVKGVQYLIENGIINVELKHSTPTQPIFQLDTKTIQISSEGSSFAKISGKIQNYKRGDPVIISVTKPDRTNYQLSIYAKSSGEFTTPLEFDKNSITGIYTISINYGSQNLGKALVDVVEQGATQEERLSVVVNCGGGVEGAVHHDNAWWDAQRSRFMIIEENMTILKQPTGFTCGPTSGAMDLLHWNSTIAPGIVKVNSTQLISDLAKLMHVKEGYGSDNQSIAMGLSEYINKSGNGGKLKVSLYGHEYENKTINPGKGAVNLVHVDTINSTVLYNAMSQKSNVIVIIQSPDGREGHAMKLLAINSTQNSEGYYKIAFIDPRTGERITSYLGDDGSIDYNGNAWYIVDIITITPTAPK